VPPVVACRHLRAPASIRHTFSIRAALSTLGFPCVSGEGSEMIRSTLLVAIGLAAFVSCAVTPEVTPQRVETGRALCATTRICLTQAIHEMAQNPDPEQKEIGLTRLGQLNTQLTYCEMLLYLTDVVPDPETYSFAERRLAEIAEELAGKSTREPARRSDGAG